MYEQRAALAGFFFYAARVAAAVEALGCDFVLDLAALRKHYEAGSTPMDTAKALIREQW